MLTTFEALTLMIAFASLVVAIISLSTRDRSNKRR